MKTVRQFITEMTADKLEQYATKATLDYKAAYQAGPEHIQTSIKRALNVQLARRKALAQIWAAHAKTS